MAASWQAAPRRTARSQVARPRRVSGPLRPAPANAPITNAFDRVRAVPDSRFLDGLLRSRAWIWLIGIALGGIVAMQVSLLKLNAGISRAVEASATLERQNAELESIVAGLASGERVRQAAENRGMILPDAGSIGFLTARAGDADAGKALRRMQPPSAEAIALQKARGREPGAVAPATTTAGVPVQTAIAPDPAAAAQQQVPAQQAPAPAPTAAAPPPDTQAATAGGASPTP